jgi:hypothetical protein
MSLKTFIDSTTDIVNKFGSTLPIPYIEKVEIHNLKMDVQTAIYVEIPAEDYAMDEGANFLETFDDIYVSVMPIYDRGSYTQFCAFQENGLVTPADFTNLPINAWTEVSTGVQSPTKYLYSPTFNDMITSKLVKYDWSLVLSSDNEGDPIWAEAFNYSGFFESFPHTGYKLPNGEVINEENLVNYVSDSVLDGTYATKYAAYSDLLPYMLDLMVQKNDKDLVVKFFGIKTYDVTVTETSEEPSFTTTESEWGITGHEIIIFPTRLNCIKHKLEDYTIADTMISSNGSAYIKLVNNSEIGVGEVHPAVYNADYDTGTVNMGLVAFSLPWDPKDIDELNTLREAYDQNSGTTSLWETSISGYSHVKVVANDALSLEPMVMYIDASGNLYEEAVRTIDGSYYSVDETFSNSILADMTAIPELLEVSENTRTSFQYLLSTVAQDPMDLLPMINQYRRAYPEKQPTNAEGRLYYSFSDILYNANTLAQRGTPLQKTLRNNPIVRDLRNVVAESSTLPSSFITYSDSHHYSLFSLDDALWSRYTEVVGIDSSQADVAGFSGVSSTGHTTVTSGVTSEINGGQYNYNFIDHAFMFFNYEKALKTTCYAARYLNVDYFEKYFGQQIMNSLFQMQKIYVGAYFATQEHTEHSSPSGPVYGTAYEDATPVGIMTADINVGLNSQTTSFSLTNELTYSDAEINADKFSTKVSNQSAQTTVENGFIEDDNGYRLSNDFGGADHMIADAEYSFIKMRGFSPVTIQEASQPLYMGQTFAEIRNLNYRLACFEMQKNDFFNAHEIMSDAGEIQAEFMAGATSGYADESDISIEGYLREIRELNQGIGFRASLLVRDTTHEVLLYLFEKIDLQYELFSDYATAAADTCSYNEAEEYFNDFFVETVQANFPNGSDAPYYLPVVYTLILEDIFFGTFGGADLALTDEVKRIAYLVSPATGTLTGVQNFLTRMETLRLHMDTLRFAYGALSGDRDYGHIFGHNPLQSSTYATALSTFESILTDVTPIKLEGAIGASSNPRDVVWKPGGVYDNFPIYPTGYVTTDVTVTIPRDPPETLTDILDAYTGAYDMEGQMLHDTIQSAVLSMIDSRLNEIADSFEAWNLEDFIDSIMRDVGSTFPDATDTILSEGLSTTLGSATRETNIYGMNYAALARMASGVDRATSGIYGSDAQADLETLATFINGYMSSLAMTYFQNEINNFGNYQTGGTAVASTLASREARIETLASHFGTFGFGIDSYAETYLGGVNAAFQNMDIFGSGLDSYLAGESFAQMEALGQNMNIALNAGLFMNFAITF